MKFSWKWLNNTIDLKKTCLREFKHKLTLAGFEIDDIKYVEKIHDSIINIDITANRQDVCSITGLTEEISTVLNITNNINTRYNYLTKDNEIKLEREQNIYLDTILNIKNIKSPSWLINYLQISNIKISNVFYDIPEYIKIKWGINIYIIDTSKINSKYKNHNLNTGLQIFNDQINLFKIPELVKYIQKSIEKNTIQDTLQCYSQTQNILIYYQEEAHNNYKSYSYNINKVFQACNEAILLFRIYTHGIHKKPYISKVSHSFTRTIDIKKKNIYQILGKINNIANGYMNVNSIYNILKRLNFNPTYNHATKKFTVYIPQNRSDDLVRSVDIIEEIGRIYGFNKFISIIPNRRQQGKISSHRKIIKKIRNILKYLGLNESINYSLKGRSTNTINRQVNIYNPLIKDQSTLQTNIASNLINTDIYNIHQNNKNNAIFEIGKVFQLNRESASYTEKIHIGGLLGGYNFYRESWANKLTIMTWFHAKGLLEIFFERLSAQIYWQPYNEKINCEYILHIKRKIYIERSAYIFNQNTHELLGILSELKPENNRIEYPRYIFEIDFETLLKSRQISNNQSYFFQNYSTYPSIIRDISINLNNLEYIHDIKYKILNQQYPLIESIDVFNEYPHASNYTRNIGLRIIYRSKHKTLKESDIIPTHENILSLLNKETKNDK